ncbi:hypothetical protein ACYEXS_19605 [Paenibacillus sp. MAH-36]|uniref:Uncharacterized protein n=1 Tax=Paenibacillus violae TaxID=3077234 RepID=A0ABU3R7B1_9BACL|nr:hypothetical protein [Paenibacillus sp. PFR10]MDU0200151.1 hypothetical protein [Paenibacillus sp. PFR10]
MSIQDDFRRLHQAVKRMTGEQFVKKMNMMHSNAWYRCKAQYEEALEECIPPKVREKVMASFERIVKVYDNISEITVDLQAISEQDFREVIQENRRLGYERMIQIIEEELKK